jgi:hypothetical protein
MVFQEKFVLHKKGNFTKGSTHTSNRLLRTQSLWKWSQENSNGLLIILSLWHLFRPSGQILPLNIPHMENTFYIVRSPPGHPEQASFVSTLLSKEELFSDYFHFYVTNPSALKRCASCHQQIGHNALGIQTDITCILLWWNCIVNWDPCNLQYDVTIVFDNLQRECRSCESSFLLEW